MLKYDFDNINKQDISNNIVIVFNSLDDLFAMSENDLLIRRNDLKEFLQSGKQPEDKIKKEINQINFVFETIKSKEHYTGIAYLSDGTELNKVEFLVVDAICEAYRDVGQYFEVGNISVNEIIKFADGLIKLRDKFISHVNIENVVLYICESTRITDIQYYMPEEIHYEFDLKTGRFIAQFSYYEYLHKIVKDKLNKFEN